MIDVRCSKCGKLFNVKPSRLERLKTGLICCSTECSSLLKKALYLGDKNPNYKHDRSLDFIYEITHDGAYLLGLIYSDGTIRDNSIIIHQNAKDSGFLLEHISNLIYGKPSLAINLISGQLLTINDKRLVDFILSLGGIKKGKKNKTVCLPDIPKDKMWSFICGYFDGDGGFKYDYKYPKIKITSNSHKLLSQIAEYWEVNYTGKDNINASGYKALDICGKMYENVSLRHSKKYYYFLDILNWEPLPSGPWFDRNYFKCKKLSEKAIIPLKKRITDSGYDIFAVEFSYDKNLDLYILDSRLAIEPLPGYYFDLVGRSSLPKNGLMFVGGVGIIDRSYVGSIKMYVKKLIDDVNIDLPFKFGQLIPRKIIHANFIEVENLSESSRGSDGFGSTGK